MSKEVRLQAGSGDEVMRQVVLPCSGLLEELCT